MLRRLGYGLNMWQHVGMGVVAGVIAGVIEEGQLGKPQQYLMTLTAMILKNKL